MNIFVTLGTTPFDSLVEYLDKNLSHLNLTIQTKGFYQPENVKYFDFSKEIDKYYDSADVVISHAGAGSIYTLLEANKKLIVVPNFERVDSHQSDIAKYLEEKKFSLVAWNIDDIEECLDKLKSGFVPDKYSKLGFFKFDEISSFLNLR